MGGLGVGRWADEYSTGIRGRASGGSTPGLAYGLYCVCGVPLLRTRYMLSYSTSRNVTHNAKKTLVWYALCHLAC